MLKKIMIPLAAFAVTVTGASAFTGSGWLQNSNVDLTDTQVSAFEQAREIRQTANDEARQVLEKAGVDETKMREIQTAMNEEREVHREAVQTAIENNDYQAFLTAVTDSPMADKITSEADFEKFIEAHGLMQSGDRDGAEEIFTELGVERGEGLGGRGEGRGDGYGRGDSEGKEGGMRDGFGGPGSHMMNR